MFQQVLQSKFVDLCKMGQSVLGCRLTPLQKANIVRMIKESENPPPVTSAVGDGANDTSMIQEAHVGFGIYGKEGRQAVNTADYAIGQFRFLKRSFLFHGYHYYTRSALTVQYFFYKNLVFMIPQILFGIFSNFSSQTVYADLYLLAYNTSMTAFPIIFFGIFEQALPENLLMNVPQLYRSITKNKLMSWKYFCIWSTFAIWHGVTIFFGAYFLMQTGTSQVRILFILKVLITDSLQLYSRLKVMFKLNIFYKFFRAVEKVVLTDALNHYSGVINDAASALKCDSLFRGPIMSSKFCCFLEK